MSAIQNAYTGSYNYNNTENIYVHLHSNNIGKAAGKSGITPNEISQVFQDQRNKAIDASQRQFKDLFFESLDEDSRKLLEAAFESGQTNMTDVQREIGRQLQEALNIQKLQNLMDLETKRYNINDLAQRIINENSLEAYNELINLLQDAVDLITSKEGSLLAVGLLRPKNVNGSYSFRGKRSKLLRALEEFKNQNNGKEILDQDIKRINAIIGFINSLAEKLAETSGRNRRDGYNSADTLKSAIENVFSSGFAEVLAGEIKRTSENTIIAETDVYFTGKDEVQIAFTDENGAPIGLRGDPSAGKADIKFKNISLSLQSLLGKDKGSIKINLGLSNKFYITGNFHNLDGQGLTEGNFHSGSGGTIQEALIATFGHYNSHLEQIYYSYNVLSHSNNSNWKIPYYALKHLLLTRQIVRLFASRGGIKDFAQYMLLNGKVVPIWDILLSTIENINYTSNQQEGAVSLYISGESGIREAAQTRKRTLEQRIIKVNQEISRAKISATLKLARLIDNTI